MAKGKRNEYSPSTRYIHLALFPKTKWKRISSLSLGKSLLMKLQFSLKALPKSLKFGLALCDFFLDQRKKEEFAS